MATSKRFRSGYFVPALAIFFGMASSGIAAPPIQSGPWEELGGSASQNGISDGIPSYSHGTPSIAVDSNGMIYVAWNRLAGTFADNDVFVKKWTGQQWIGLGGSELPSFLGDVFEDSPALVIDPQDRPILVWRGADSLVHQIYLLRWDGQIWEELVGSASGGGISQGGPEGGIGYPRLAIDPAGNPIVAWQKTLGDGGFMTQIYVKKWNPTSQMWDPFGSSPAVEGMTFKSWGGAYSLAVDAQRRPAITWSDQFEVYFLRWNGAAWVEFGTSASTGGISADTANSEFPSLALDSRGFPAIAWTGGRGGNIYLRRWNGTTWEELGGSTTGKGLSPDPSALSLPPSITVDSTDNPIVVWGNFDVIGAGDFEVYAKRWNETSWEWLPAGGPPPRNQPV